MTQAKLIHQTPAKVIDILCRRIWIGVNEILPTLIPPTGELPQVTFAVNPAKVSYVVIDGDRKIIENDSPL